MRYVCDTNYTNFLMNIGEIYLNIFNLFSFNQLYNISFRHFIFFLNLCNKEVKNFFLLCICNVIYILVIYIWIFLITKQEFFYFFASI